MNEDSAHNTKLSSRKRIPLSCNQCKRRKVKCDRKSPCSSCVKHKIGKACEYLEDQVMNHETAGTLMVFKRKQDSNVGSIKPGRGKRSKKTVFQVNQTNLDNLDHANVQNESKSDSLSQNNSNDLNQNNLNNLNQNNSNNLNQNNSNHLNQNNPDHKNINSNNSDQSNQNLNQANPAVNQNLNVNQHIQNPPLMRHPDQMQFIAPPYANFAPNNYGDHGGRFGMDAGHAKPNPPNDKSAPGFMPEMCTGFGAPFVGPGNGHFRPPAGFPTGIPANIPAGIPRNIPAGIPAGIQTGAPAGAPAGFPTAIPAGIQGMPRSPEESPENKSDLDEAFDLYTGYSSVFREGGKNINHGPFSWFSYIQKDKALRALWDVSNQQHRDDAFKKVPEGQGSEEIRSSERGSVGETPVLNRNQVSPNTRRDLKANLNKKTLALGLTVFEGAMDQSLDIIEKLKLILPNKRALFLLVKRFFQVVYPYMCVLDETYFRGEITAILGPECKSEERFDHINIRKRKDFATMGILLIVLRISYLSTFSNIRSENEDIVNSPYSLSDDMGSESNGPGTGDSGSSEYFSQRQRTLLFESKYILTHPVSIDFMDYVQACLDQFTGAQKCSLSVLQCLMMKRIYSDVAPEETNSADGYDTSALNATCIHIGLCLGIHRDLDFQCGQEMSVQETRYANICRKIWFFVQLMDLKLAWQFGFPIMVDHNYSNSKVPYYTCGASNVLNDDVEIKLCSLLTWTGTFYRNFGEMMRRCLMLQYPLRVSELLSLMDMFEGKVYEDLGTLSDYTSSGVPKSSYYMERKRQRSRKSNSKSSFSTGSPGIKIEFNAAEMSKEKVLESSDFPFVKVLKLKVYLNMKQFSMSIFYHLFLNFEKSQRFDLSFSYISKVISFCCREFIPEILDLLLSSRSNFDSASTTPGLILNNSIIGLIHKCDQIFFSIIARARFKILKMKQSPDHKHLVQTSEAYRHRFGSVCNLTNILSDIVKFTLCCLARLNHRYYYAWRIFKTHTYVLKKTASEDFYQKLTKLDYHFIELTQPQIDQILVPCQECFNKIESILKQFNLSSTNENGDGNGSHEVVQGLFNPGPGMRPMQGSTGNPNGPGYMMGTINEQGQHSNGAAPGIKIEQGQKSNGVAPETKTDQPSFPQSYQNIPENYDFEDYIPSMGIDNFALEIPETDLLWQQINDMKEDNKREFTKDAPNDISDKFFPLSPQQDIFPPFDMNGAFEGFSNIYV